MFEKTDKQLEQTTETLTQTKGQLQETKENLKEKTVECEEQKFLVTEHVKTEKELFSQAEQVSSIFLSNQNGHILIFSIEIISGVLYKDN